MKYHISVVGAKQIGLEEKFMAKPYLCPAGVPTIGYGSTFYPSGRKVTLQDAAITKDQALNILMWYIDTIAIPVIEKVITVELNQNQVDSLCSFIYNVGAKGFASSTLAKKINAGASCEEIHAQFMRWVRANGKIMPGLQSRRRREASQYCKQ